MADWEPYRMRTGTPYYDWLHLRQQRGGPAVDTASMAGYDCSDWQQVVGGFSTVEAGQGGRVDIPPVLERIQVPLPEFARRPEGAGDPPPKPDAAALTQPKKGMAIVGIIDAAINLGHMRFRHGDGKTRFLSSWQMDAVYAQGPNDKLFGREVWEDEINAGIDAQTKGDVLDEDALNAALGLYDLAHKAGNREALSVVSHGCHVLDTAAGYDPLDADAMDEAALRPIIAVNLPSKKHIGASGTFLEYFVVAAIDHIILSAQDFVSRDPSVKGLPIVINISYGVQAGPKDGSGLVERYMAEVSAAATADMPVHFVLPAGNENVDKLNAAQALAKGESYKIDWHVLPEDHTDNYVEVYAQVPKTDMPSKGDLPLVVSLRLPDGREYNPPAGKAGHLFSLGDDPDAPVGRLYCDLVGPACDRIRYVLALCSTYDRTGGLTAPPGVYQITFSSKVDLSLNLSIQSDQSVGSGPNTGLSSMFEDPAYREYDDAGRLIDTPVPSEAEASSAVTRFGTVNAIATSVARNSHVVAGHRASDGVPAVYSSTTRMGEGVLIDASFPTDDSPTRGGILAAGSRSGGVVAMRGTSFAAGQATRWVAEVLANGGTVDLPAVAQTHDPNASDFLPEKIGAGRMVRQGARRVER